MAELNKHITILDPERKKHSKASEEYLDVQFDYNEEKRNVWVPVEYRRTGVSINDENELNDHLNYVYEEMKPEKYSSWLKEEEKFWDYEKPNANVTREFFEGLKSGEWKCIACELPKNSNPTRRIQDLKELGYTLATNKMYCERCKKKTTHLMMLPIKRGSADGNGYETWSPELRKRILRLLNNIDVYEYTENRNCLPDHKFSEIRWDQDTKSENPDHMTDDEIRNKFQLLTNQRNQQKREVCRKCYQTGQRGKIFGIEFYYQGGPEWDETIPRKGKNAEQGCVGCPWYDIQRWREELQKRLEE